MSTFSRRWVLPFLALLIWTGCSKETPSQNASAGAVPAAPAAEEPVLNVYNWAEYISPATVERFEKETGIKVNLSFYDSNETMLAKLEAGAREYDVVFPSDYMVQIMIRKDFFLPLDKSLLPNATHLDPMLLNQYYDPENRFSLPYMFGTTGIAIRTDKVTTKIEGWKDILQPAPELKGQLSMLADKRDVIGIALKMKGYSINSTNPKELQEAKALLTAQKPFVKVYDSSSYKINFESGEVKAGMAWGGDIASMYWKGNKNLKYIFPKEGGPIYSENMVVLKQAPHPKNAHAFINFLMRPQEAAETTNTTFYATANKDATPYIKPELLADSSIFPPADVRPKLKYYRELGEANALYGASGPS